MSGAVKAKFRKQSTIPRRNNEKIRPRGLMEKKPKTQQCQTKTQIEKENLKSNRARENCGGGVGGRLKTNNAKRRKSRKFVKPEVQEKKEHTIQSEN